MLFLQMIYWRVGCVTTNWMCCFSAAHCSEQTQRKTALRRESQPSRSRPGAVLATSSKWMKAKVFSNKSLGLSVCTCYGKKATKRVSKLLNIVLKSRLCVWDTVADCRGWLILRRLVSNKSTYGKHWRFSVRVSTVLEHTERAVRNT